MILILKRCCNPAIQPCQLYKGSATTFLQNSVHGMQWYCNLANCITSLRNCSPCSCTNCTFVSLRRPHHLELILFDVVIDFRQEITREVRSIIDATILLYEFMLLHFVFYI